MSFDPEKITFFAKTDARGKNVSFGIKARDRQRHMYIVGKTGMGKSTLLENMAVQDIQNGEGMAFIDPHGSAAELLLEYIPEHRINDVVYFAPFDLEHPISFNVMEDVGHDKRHLVVSGLMSTFKKIWVDVWSARMEYILTNALLVLIEYPDTTLLSVNRIFNDKAYRLKVVDYCTDPAVKSFWVDEFANYTERFAAEALPAIQNKIGQFTGNPLIRNIIGQPHSSFDFRKCMDEKKIVIMNLSKGLVGETNANLLGSMLTTRIYLAAMSRADIPVAQMKLMPNFYFYVDEFQSFANATFANILSEARKYHLNLIIAHQYIEQMEEEVRDAVFGNVGTTISFRVGPFDAETLETVFTPRFLAADLVNLGFAQIYLTLMIDGIGSQPFSARTLDPILPPSISYKDMVVAASRRNFTKPRIEVEKIVTDLHTPAKVEKTEKKTPNQNPQPYVKPVATTTSTPANSGSAQAYPRAATLSAAPKSDETTETLITVPTPAPTSVFASPQARHSTSSAISSLATAPGKLMSAPSKEIIETPSVLASSPAQKPLSHQAPASISALGAQKSTSSPASDQAPTSVFASPQARQSTSSEIMNPHPKPSYNKQAFPSLKSSLSPAAKGDFSQRKNHTPKPPAAPKTEDLRSILAKIAQQSNKPDTNNKDVSKKTTAVTATDTTHTEPSPFKKIETTISPLQAALAQLKKVDAENIPRVLPPRPFPLPTSFTPASVVIKTEAENLHFEIETVFASLENKSATAVTPPSVSSAPVSSKVGEQSGAGVSPSSLTTNPLTPESGLDPKHLARILRPTAPERSPFR